MTPDKPEEIDKQLELEMQSLAELLLDIYEWKQREKRKGENPQLDRIEETPDR